MIDLVQTMIQHAHAVLPNAYAPYSNLNVASCVYGANDKFYVGVNIENAAYGLTICAEIVAISHMVTGGCKKIHSLVVLSDQKIFCSPCGACRQRIFEFSTPSTLIYICMGQTVIKSIPIAKLLPYAFNLT